MKQLVLTEEQHELLGRMERLFWEAREKDISFVYDISDGTLVSTYDSATDAERKTGISRGGIQKCCIGKYSQAKGFVWKYI